MRRSILLAALVLLASSSAFAQIAVHDPAVTARNAITAIVWVNRCSTSPSCCCSFRSATR